MLGGTGRQWGRFVVTVAAASLAVALAAPATAGATGRPREVVKATFLDSGLLKVLAAGHTWRLSVSGDLYKNSVSLEAFLSRSGSFGSETHDWSFGSASGSLTKVKTGVWRLKSSSTAKPLGSVDLTFTATKHTAGACRTGSETIYTGSLKGTFWLHTGFKPGGTVGGKTLTFPAPNTLTVDSNCAPKQAGIPCTTSVSGNENPSSQSAASAFGSSTGGSSARSTISVGRYLTLSKPAGASRYDSATAEGPGTSLKNGKVSFKPDPGTILTGAVTFTTSGAKSVYKHSCLEHGTKHTETDTSWYSGSASSTMAANFVLGGKVKTPSNAAAYITDSVVS